MTLIDRTSLQVLDRLHQRMQELVAELLQTRCESTLWVGSTDLTWVTEVNVQETETNLVLSVRLPGVQAEELEVEVTQETAVIRCRPAIASATLGLGQFQNVIPFPVPTHPEAVRATFEREHLTLTLPKAANTQRQSVRVLVSEQALESPSSYGPAEISAQSLSNCASLNPS